MSKSDFLEFDVGHVFNGVKLEHDPIVVARGVTVTYPSRLEAMALDPAKIADNDNLVYEAGQIDVCIDYSKVVTATLQSRDAGLSLSDRTPRKSLVRHAATIMQKALGVNDPLHIDVEDRFDLRHCGLGSSSSLVASTAAAVNELYGKPVSALDLVRYCAQNHGEEIDGQDNILMPVQCIGGSAVCGHFEGGLVILSGQATPIFTSKLDDSLSVVIGIPSDFTHPDSRALMNAEVENLDKFRNSGKAYGQEVAYRLVHEVMPGLASGNMKPCKDLVFDYRWEMGSIDNCSFVYPRMKDIARDLRWMREDEDIKMVSLSSVGPGFFCVTDKPDKVSDSFKELEMNVHLANVHNNTYGVKMHE